MGRERPTRRRAMRSSHSRLEVHHMTGAAHAGGNSSEDCERLYRGLFEQTAFGVAHVGLDGRWLEVNDRLCAIVGYDRAELLAKTFQDITHPDDLNADLDQVRR